MRRRRTLIVLAAVVYLGLGPASIHATGEKVNEILQAGSSGYPWLSVETEVVAVRAPEPGSGESSVGPGEAMYSERHQTLLRLITNFAVLKEEFFFKGRKGVQLPVGTELGNFFLTDSGKPTVYMRCSKAHTSIKQTLLGRAIYKSAVCFREINGFLVPSFFKKYPTPPSVRLRYELRPQLLESAVRGEGSYELLYQGVGGGVLRLTYREFTGDDLARPAFTQEVTYDVCLARSSWDLG